MKHHSRWAGLLADSAPADFRGYSLNASCAPSLLAEARLPGCHKSSPPSSRGYGTEAGLRVLRTRLAKIRAKGARSASTCGGEFKPRNIAGRSGPKLSMTQSPQRDPSLEKRPQRRTGPKFPGKGRQRGPNRAVNSVPRLNMGETDSEQVPRGKDEKDFEKRVKECLKLSGGKRMGPAMRPGRMRTEQSVRRSIRSWTDAD
ncbi:hypothetical protein Bca4012_103858 [Brassica carinata]